MLDVMEQSPLFLAAVMEVVFISVHIMWMQELSVPHVSHIFGTQSFYYSEAG